MADPEIAQEMLDAEDARKQDGEDDVPWSPPLTEFNLHAQLIMQLIDTVNALQATVTTGFGGKASRPKPLPRPRTQIDIIRERRSDEVQASIIATFAPHALK